MSIFCINFGIVRGFALLSISSTIISMGLVVTASSLIIALVNVAVNRLSDIKGSRIEFAIIGSILYSVWYFALTFASNAVDIVLLSLLSGLASAFSLSWFAYYGDSFGREFHASILVMMEAGLMVGRIINLLPTYVFITSYDYASYFEVLSIASLLLMPVLLLYAWCMQKA